MVKITSIVREEMDRMGGQEIYLPALNPAEVWQESGRWDAMERQHDSGSRTAPVATCAWA